MTTGRSRYHFVTRWRFDAPIEAVWEEIAHPERWPEWWHGVERVELVEAGDAAGIGACREMTWRSRLPYRLRFRMRTVRVDRPRRLEGHATGELEGVGVWTLESASSGTSVTYDWQVDATKPWMRALAPVARPLFAWNHDVIMRWGFEGLRKRLTRSSASRA